MSDKSKRCRSCARAIDRRAVKCRYCAAPQSFMLRHNRTLNVSLIVALLAVSGFQYAGMRVFADRAESDFADRKLAESLLQEAAAIQIATDFKNVFELTRERFERGLTNELDPLRGEADLAEAGKNRLALKFDVEERWQKASR